MGNITWFGHASFSFKDTNGNQIYYIDPFDLTISEPEKADLVFITHAHPDHFSPNDIAKIVKNETIIIAPPDILAKIERAENLKLAVEPNKSYEIKGFRFQTIPAYNNNPEKLQFHPKMNKGKEFPSTCIRFPSSQSFAATSRRDKLPMRNSECGVTPENQTG